MGQFKVYIHQILRGTCFILVSFLAIATRASNNSYYSFSQMINGTTWTAQDISNCTKLYGKTPQQLIQLDPRSRGASVFHFPMLTVKSADLKSYIPYANVIWGLKIPDATDDTLKILDKFPNLQKLDLNYTKVTDHALQIISKNCPKLTKLKVGWCYITDKNLSDLKKLGQLNALNLSKTFINDKGIESLPTTLNKLNVTACNITDKGVMTIANRMRLGRLNLTGCNKVTYNAFQYLSQLLRALDVYGGLPTLTPDQITQLKARIPALNTRVKHDITPTFGESHY